MIKNNNVEFSTKIEIRYNSREVAQSGSAQRSGRWGRRFKSSLPDQENDRESGS